MKKNLERCKKAFHVLPTTFVLPKEYVKFVEAFSEAESTDGALNYWILKPCAMSRGRGIQLINDITSVSYGEQVVLQRYMKNPLLLNGFKFDLRIYILVTSFNPLEAFVYKEGFARISTQPFSLSPHDMTNKFVHLTNYSIQKKSKAQFTDVGCDLSDQIYGGSKISLSSLAKVFQGMKIDYDDIWDKIEDVCLKTLVGC